MERVVKFRGKDVKSGEWVYGSLVTYPNGRCEIVVFDDGEILEHEVDAESVGQFTGLHDKDGKEVYEGDVLVICEYKNMLTGVVCEEGEHELFTLDELKGELQQQYKFLHIQCF